MPPQISAVNPSGATQRGSFGKHEPSLRGQGLDPGLTGTSRRFPLRGNVEGPHRSLHPHSAHVLPQPLPSSSTFPVKTNPWGRGQRRSSRVPRKPGQQTQTHASGPARPSPRFASLTPAGPGVAGEEVTLLEAGWWEAARRAVAGTGPAGCKQRPSGRDPAASRAPSPRPPRHPPWQLGARALLPRGTAVRGQARGLGEQETGPSRRWPRRPSAEFCCEASEGGSWAAPRRRVPVRRPWPITSGPATPSPGMDTHRTRRGDDRRRRATGRAWVKAPWVSPHPAQH